MSRHEGVKFLASRERAERLEVDSPRGVGGEGD
jgi:hypothetical protein